MVVFDIKRNDTKPYLAVQLLEANGSAVNLTTGSYIFFNLGTNDNNFSPVLSGNATITGSATGNVEYHWGPGETNRSGLFLGEFEVTFNDSTVLTLPSDHSLFVKINEDYDGN